MKNFIRNNKVALASAIATVGTFVGATFALAVDPTTLPEVVTSAVDTVKTSYTDALIANLGTIIGAVVAIAVTFILIKLAMRWVKHSVH